MGIRDLLLTNPAELTRHKFVIIEMLGVRVGDDDKVVRETLYQLFKTVIFLGCKEVKCFFAINAYIKAGDYLFKHILFLAT